MQYCSVTLEFHPFNQPGEILVASKKSDTRPSSSIVSLSDNPPEWWRFDICYEGITPVLYLDIHRNLIELVELRCFQTSYTKNARAYLSAEGHCGDEVRLRYSGNKIGFGGVLERVSCTFHSESFVRYRCGIPGGFSTCGERFLATLYALIPILSDSQEDFLAGLESACPQLIKLVVVPSADGSHFLTAELSPIVTRYLLNTLQGSSKPLMLKSVRRVMKDILRSFGTRENARARVSPQGLLGMQVGGRAQFFAPNPDDEGLKTQVVTSKGVSHCYEVITFIFGLAELTRLVREWQRAK